MDETANDFTTTFLSREEQLQQLTRLFDLTNQDDGTAEITPVDANNTAVLRRLNALEVETLQGASCRCHCGDWSKLFVLLDASNSHQNQSSKLAQLVTDTRFDGTILLDLMGTRNTTRQQSMDGADSNDWHKLPPGIHSNLMVSNSMFKLSSCRVYRNSFLSDSYVGEDSVVINCGHISASAKDTTGCCYGRLSIEVGPETGGGRNLHLTSESTMIQVCHQLRNGGGGDSGVTPHTHGNIRNVFSQECIVRDTPTVQNVYLHEGACIEAAAAVCKATLFPNARITNSSSVSNILLQWDASVVDHSTVTNALLMEQSQSGPNSIVASAVLGPDVHVSAGEVHASVIGPNTNGHHQSLVIGVLWPMGRGNVGYGANVGSNHTGRIPDQETSAGEGTFWGLSCVIKFPVDLTYAPYSIVAAGTSLAPQRVCMPFSLIVSSSSSGNDIIPGWVLQSSPYTLARSEKKFATRRKAKRHDFYTGWKIFRPEIMEMCRWARKELEAGGEGEEKMNRRIQGLGGNKLTDRARSVGIKAYVDCIQLYALRGLLDWIIQNSVNANKSIDVNVIHYELLGKEVAPLPLSNPSEQVEWPLFPWDKTTNEWEYQRSLLLEEFPVDMNISAWLENLLRSLVMLEKDLARRIHKCKSRDDSRGAATIPGYSQAHVSADKDPVVLEARKRSDAIEASVSRILEKLSASTRCRL